MSDDFKIGELSGQIRGLVGSMGELRSDVKDIKETVEDLKLWRAKVFGISTACGIGSAAMFELGLRLLKP